MKAIKLMIFNIVKVISKILEKVFYIIHWIFVSINVLSVVLSIIWILYSMYRTIIGYIIKQDILIFIKFIDWILVRGIIIFMITYIIWKISQVLSNKMLELYCKMCELEYRTNQGISKHELDQMLREV